MKNKKKERIQLLTYDDVYCKQSERDRERACKPEPLFFDNRREREEEEVEEEERENGSSG